MLRLSLFLPLLLLALVACDDGSRGNASQGEACVRDRDCRVGLCVAGVAGGEDGACTVSCGTTDDCPRGWACSGVTQDRVLVCQRGAPTPFGIGAHE